MAYYYLAAQLPALAYNQSAPMGPSAFVALARAHLSSEDAALLEYCTLDPLGDGGGDLSPDKILPSVDPGFIDKWRNWERTLRLNLARHRAVKARREGAAALEAPEYPADAAAAAKAAVLLDSPLEAEFFLDKARWDVIDSFQGIDYFSRNTLYGYLLKLRLLERRTLFRVEEGFAEYKGLYAAILAAAGA